MNRKLVTAAVIAITIASASAAAAGVLPGAAQDTAAEALAKVGISVPGANEHSGDHPNTRGNSVDAGTTTNEANPASADTNADEIVAIATDSSIVGLDKGQAVSSLASDGHSRAGAEHPTSATPAGPPVSVPAGPPADVPAGPPTDVPAGPPASLPVGRH